MVVSTLRADATIQSSVVNAGVMAHPFGGEPVLAFVTYGKVKLAQPSRATRGDDDVSQWLAVGGRRGRAELIGPTIRTRDVDPERLRLLLREVFTAAGGSHDDWDAYDRVMLEQQRTAVFIVPTRIYSN